MYIYIQCHLLSTYYMAGILLKDLRTSSHLFFTVIRRIVNIFLILAM